MLLEMLITIGLVAIFLVLAGKLFTTTLRLTHTSNEAARDAAAFESCVAALRRDVWGAVEVVSTSEGKLSVLRGDKTIVTWGRDEEGAMVRRSGEASAETVQRWPDVGVKVSLRPDPAGLIVRSGDDELRLASQVLLTRKGTP